MSDGRRSRVAARVHLACGRVAGGARAIAEAHRFGVPDRTQGLRKAAAEGLLD